MRRLRIIALIAAITMGIGIYYFLSLINKPEEITRIQVVVADVDIPENTVVSDSMLTVKNLPSEAVLHNSVKNPEDALGKVVNSDVLAGE